MISWAWLQHQYASAGVRCCRLCHSFLTQFLQTRRAICSTDRTYELPGSHVWAVMSSEKSRSPATAIKVSKSRHNSRTKLNFFRSDPSKCRVLLVLLVLALSFQRATRFGTVRQNDRQTDTTITVCLLAPPRHKYGGSCGTEHASVSGWFFKCAHRYFFCFVLYPAGQDAFNGVGLKRIGEGFAELSNAQDYELALIFLWQFWLF